MNAKGLLTMLVALGLGFGAISCLSDDQNIRIWLAFIFITFIPAWHFFEKRALAGGPERARQAMAGSGGMLGSLWLAFAILLLILARYDIGLAH